MKKLLLMGAAICALSPAAMAASGDGVGAYTGGGTPDSFGSWLGNTMTVGSDFLNASGWPAFETLVGSSPLSTWVAWENALPNRRLVTYGIPPYAWGVSANYTACAAGSYNTHWANLAHNVLASGLKHLDLRVAWEFDGSWQAPAEFYPNGDYTHFVGCWQQIVNTVHAIDTARVITFDWNPTAGCCGYLDNNYWPGDQYVDYIGMDFYANTANVSQVATDIVNFAKSHGKRITLPEWGVWNAEDTGYMQTMVNLITNPANNVAWANYFNSAQDANHDLINSYPQSGAIYKAAFKAPYEQPGGMWPSSGSPPPPPPPPPSGPDTLKLFLSQDPNTNQNAQVQLLVDNVAFGSPLTVTAVFGSGSGQEFDISLASVAAGNHTLAVRFLNDVNNAGGDLNLHVNSFTLNGVSYQPGAGSVTCWSTDFTALYCTGDQAAYPNVPVVHSGAPAETLTVNKPPYHGVAQSITGSIANLSSAPSSLDLVVNGVASPATCPTLTATGFSCAWTPAAAGSYTIQVKDHATGAASPAVNVTIN